MPSTTEHNLIKHLDIEPPGGGSELHRFVVIIQRMPTRKEEAGHVFCCNLMNNQKTI
jgi:hypothetical protein